MISRRYTDVAKGIEILWKNCVEGIENSYPSPDTSGVYLPHPNSGGKARNNEYNRIADEIFRAVEKDDIFPSIRRKCRKLDSRHMDSTHNVIIDAKPKR